MITKQLCSTKDSTVISNLSNIIWHECYKEMLSLEQRNYMLDKFLNTSSIEKQMDEDIIFYSLYINNELAGYFAYKINKDHIYLHKLYSMHTFRGMGLMKYVLEYLFTFKKDIKLNTCKTNPTLQIYLHVGFIITSEDKHDIGNGFYMDDYNLTKKYVK